MSYDDCPKCGTKMTGFTTLFCPKEDEHTTEIEGINTVLIKDTTVILTEPNLAKEEHLLNPR